MRRARSFLVAFLFFMVAAISSFAQTRYDVYIRGTAYYQSGKPVIGASVSLKWSKLTGKSDSLGAFFISGTVATRISHYQRNQEQKPVVKDGRLQFFVPVSGSRVKIEAFDLRGKSISVLADANLPRGDYTVPVKNGRFANQGCVLRTVIGSSSDVLYLALVRSSSKGMIRTKENTSAAGGLLKLTATLDTIYGEVQGSPAVAKAIDAWNTNVFLVFENPAGTGDNADAALSELPMVTPVTTSSCWYRGCYYFTSLVNAPFVPVFNPDSTSYAASRVTGATTTVYGIRPVARSAAAKFSVTLDNAPIERTLWKSPNSGFWAFFYACTLNDTTTTRTFTTTVTSGNGLVKKNYYVTIK